MEDKDYDKIELRSDKVRRIIGRVPPRLVRTGTAVIAVAMTALLFAAATVHFPITVEAHGGVVDGGLKVEVPYRFLYLFDRPRVAWVRFLRARPRVHAMPTPLTVAVLSFTPRLTVIPSQPMSAFPTSLTGFMTGKRRRSESW